MKDQNTKILKENEVNETGIQILVKEDPKIPRRMSSVGKTGRPQEEQVVLKRRSTLTGHNQFLAPPTEIITTSPRRSSIIKGILSSSPTERKGSMSEESFQLNKIRLQAILNARKEARQPSLPCTIGTVELAVTKDHQMIIKWKMLYIVFRWAVRLSVYGTRCTNRKSVERHEKVDSRSYALESTAIFQQLPAYLSKLALFFEFHTYEKDDVIQKQDDSIKNLHWIIKGSVNVTKIVPFISKSNNGKVVLKAYVKDQEFVPFKKGNEEEKLLLIELGIQDALHPGDWFPYIPLSDIPATEKNDTLYRTWLDHQSECKITAAEKVVTASITSVEFLDVCSLEVVRAFIANTYVRRFAVELLQEQYLEQRHWDSHKRSVVGELFPNGPKENPRKASWNGNTIL